MADGNLDFWLSSPMGVQKLGTPCNRVTLSCIVGDCLSDEEYEFYGDYSGLDDCDEFEWGGRYLLLKNHQRYDSSGQMTYYTISEWSGDNIEYTYDPNLTGATVWYDYSAEGQVTKIKYGASGSTEDLIELVYDESGRVITQSGSCSTCGFGTTVYAYDDYDNIVTVWDADNNVIQSNYWEYSQGYGICTKTCSGPFTRWKHEYDYANNRITKNNAEDNDTNRVVIEEFENNSMSSPTRIFQYDDFDMGGTCLTTTYSYDSDKMYEITPNSVTHASYYNDDYAGGASYGQITKDTVKSAIGEISREYTYTNVNYAGGGDMVQLASIVDERGGETVYNYSNKGVITKQIDPNSAWGQLTHYYEYDLRQRITQECRASSGSPVGGTTTYAYDHCDNLTKTIEAYGTASAATTNYGYDIFNHQTLVTDPRGNAQTQLYTPGGALTSQAAFASGSGGNVLSQTKYEYDANARMTRKLVADDTGSFTVNSPSSWITTSYCYDVIGRRTMVIEDDGGLNLTTRYMYNNQDEVIRTTTPGGVWTHSERDGRGLVIKETMGFEGSIPTDEMVTEYDYDGDGNLLQVVPPSGVTTKYEYDGFGRRTKMIQGYKFQRCKVQRWGLEN